MKTCGKCGEALCCPDFQQEEFERCKDCTDEKNAAVEQVVAKLTQILDTGERSGTFASLSLEKLAARLQHISQEQKAQSIRTYEGQT